MYNFHKGLYTDIRIEDFYETKIIFTQGKLDELKEKNYIAAFIRVFDGKKWYYSSVTDMDCIQSEIDKLCDMAVPCADIDEDPVVQLFEVNKGKYMTFEDVSIRKKSISEKKSLLTSFFPYLEEVKEIKTYKTSYIDTNVKKHFISSKGADIEFDFQKAGFSLGFSMVHGEKRVSESFERTDTVFEKLTGHEKELKEYLEKCLFYLENYVQLEPGAYTAILSPQAAGVFAHESFGHKSESDFMLGDENMKKEWAIGKKVGSDILSIVDSGKIPGSGYVQFDDEGTKAGETYLIKNGTLAGRLHSAYTAAALQEKLTGNARAKDFEYEPIVRMTSTYILPGDKTKEQLISEVSDGILIETINHGSGMSDFTIAPRRAYRIRNGEIAEPVSISVITGNVFSTLNEIDGLSDKLEIFSFIMGGCGKMEQYPLSVGFGGPYVRVRTINAR